MDVLWQDTKFAARVLARNPGFTLVALLTLALGIGGNSAMFGVVSSVLLRPLPYPCPERLVAVWEFNPQHPLKYMFASPPNFADWREQQQVFDHIAVFRPRDYTLLDERGPEQVTGTRVSGNLLATLGVSAVLGRALLAGDDQPGAPPVVILSHGFWQSRFGGSRDIIGRPITLDGESHAVVGVMSREFRFPPPIGLPGAVPASESQFWTPFRLAYASDPRGAHFLFALARLRDGVALEQAESAMITIASRIEAQFPGSNRGWSIRLVPLHQQVFEKVEPALLALLGAVGLVLLIACGNVANLLMARATARRRELALRMALGAGRLRLLRLTLTESTLLSVAGGVVGLALGFWLVRLVATFGPQSIPRLNEVRVDGSSVLFTFGIAVLTGLLFGAFPALQSARVPLATLNEGIRGTTGGSAGRIRNVLVISQIALSLLLLSGAGLLLKSFLRLRSSSFGFNAENVLTMALQLPSRSYASGEQRAQFYEQFRQKVAALPGVGSVGLAMALPLGTNPQGTGLAIEGRPRAPERGLQTAFSIATPGFFEAMGIPILRGRDFSPRDTADRPRVAVVNEAVARLAFGSEDPIGKRIHLANGGNAPWEIVGIVANLKHHITENAEQRFNTYVPYTQASWTVPMTIAVRSAQEPTALTSAIRGRLASLDPEIPLYDVRTMETVLARALGEPRFSAFLLAAFAAAAALLAAVGIYGVISYAVTQRVQEIGIRLALGAQPGDVFRMVLGQGMLLVTIGIGAGLAGAYALTQLIQSLLFEVSPSDPAVLLAVSVLLVLVSLLACALPALRATRIDPMACLRNL